MSFIEKLQNQPRYIRIQILWISVILVMAIIFFLWLVFLKSSLNISGSSQKPQAENQEQSIPSLFPTLKEDFSILKKSLETGVKGFLEGEEKEVKFEAEITKPKRLPE